MPSPARRSRSASSSTARSRKSADSRRPNRPRNDPAPRRRSARIPPRARADHHGLELRSRPGLPAERRRLGRPDDRLPRPRRATRLPSPRHPGRCPRPRPVRRDRAVDPARGPRPPSRPPPPDPGRRPDPRERRRSRGPGPPLDGRRRQRRRVVARASRTSGKVSAFVNAARRGFLATSLDTYVRASLSYAQWLADGPRSPECSALLVRGRDMDRDRRGRRRRPEQERGLRPLHPLLPADLDEPGIAGRDVGGGLGPLRRPGRRGLVPDARPRRGPTAR